MRFAGIAQRGDFALVDTVLLEGVDTKKSAADEDAAMIKGFECPGACSLKIRVDLFFSSSLMLTGLWLMLKILLCFKAAILVLVILVLAVFLAAETVAFFRIDERFPFWTVLGDFFFVSFLGVVVGRVFVVIGDMSSEEFAARGVALLSSIRVEVPC